METAKLKIPSFRLIFKGPHGQTVESDNPEQDAYQQASYIKCVLGRFYRLICQQDGSYTVQGDGLEAITFQPVTK